MADLILWLHTLQTPLRVGLGAILAVGLGMAFLSWLERTRRVSAFSPIARFARSAVDPALAPVDRFVARTGGRRTSTPWWGVFALLIAGAIVIGFVDFVRDVLSAAYASSAMGALGIVRLIVGWAFGILQLAIIVRVVTSWIGGTYSWIGRTAFVLTEWFLRPIRNLFAPLGSIDFSPIIGWFLVAFVRTAVLGLL
jgi:YggT family protein